MIDVKVETVDTTAAVRKSADKAQFRNFGHAAATIRRTAAESIQRAEGPSEPGSPPHTHRRVFLRRAIRFFVDKNKNEAIIGPRASIVGDVGEVLEFGGTRGDTVHPPRPFMLPALVAEAPRFADTWQGSIGE